VNNEDQRGLPRPVDGNGDLTPICDIGAFEAAYRYAGYGSTPYRARPDSGRLDDDGRSRYRLVYHF
jgi:hypothetical protein